MLQIKKITSLPNEWRNIPLQHNLWSFVLTAHYTNFDEVYHW